MKAHEVETEPCPACQSVKGAEVCLYCLDKPRPKAERGWPALGSVRTLGVVPDSVLLDAIDKRSSMAENGEPVGPNAVSIVSLVKELADRQERTKQSRMAAETFAKKLLEPMSDERAAVEVKLVTHEQIESALRAGKEERHPRIHPHGYGGAGCMTLSSGCFDQPDYESIPSWAEPPAPARAVSAKGQREAGFGPTIMWHDPAIPLKVSAIQTIGSLEEVDRALAAGELTESGAASLRAIFQAKGVDIKDLPPRKVCGHHCPSQHLICTEAHGHKGPHNDILPGRDGHRVEWREDTTSAPERPVAVEDDDEVCEWCGKFSYDCDCGGRGR